jgi:hypothetical protein
MRTSLSLPDSFERNGSNSQLRKRARYITAAKGEFARDLSAREGEALMI